MCIGGGSSSKTEYRDTSEEPIISKYELTEEQLTENRRRKSLLAKKKKRDSGSDDNRPNYGGTTISSGMSTYSEMDAAGIEGGGL